MISLLKKKFEKEVITTDESKEGFLKAICKFVYGKFSDEVDYGVDVDFLKKVWEIKDIFDFDLSHFNIWYCKDQQEPVLIEGVSNYFIVAPRDLPKEVEEEDGR